MQDDSMPKCPCGCCEPNVNSQQDLHALVDASGEYFLALRCGRVYAERLVPQPAPAPRAVGLAAQQGACAMVTGATGGLGLAFTKQVC